MIVGLPRTLADRTGPSALDAIDVAEALARRVAPTPVRLADERLTTVSAQRSLREAGVRAKEQRAVIDQAAAVAILQSWLDQRRATVAESGAQAGDATDGRQRTAATGRAGGSRAAPAPHEPARPEQG